MSGTRAASGRRTGNGGRTSTGGRTGAGLRARGARAGLRLRILGVRRTVALALVLVLALGGGFLWLRQSSLVAVRDVTITGAGSGPGAAAIRAALRDAALDMTTLDVSVDALRAAVGPYPVVSDLRVETHFPHGLRIEVVRRRAVAMIIAGGQRVPVAADGTLLRGGAASSDLPLIAIGTAAGPHLTDRGALAAAVLLDAAPAPLRARVERVVRTPEGITAELRDGPKVIFGTAARLRAKWAAAAAVLSDTRSAGASYIDVRVPERPVAGGLSVEAGGAPPPTASAQSPAQGAASTPSQPVQSSAPATGTPTAGTTPQMGASGGAAPPAPAPQPGPTGGIAPTP